MARIIVVTVTPGLGMAFRVTEPAATLRTTAAAAHERYFFIAFRKIVVAT